MCACLRTVPGRIGVPALLLLLALLLPSLPRPWAPPPGAAHALLDVRYDPTAKRYRSYSTCSFYLQPHGHGRHDLNSPLPSGWAVTCGLQLLPGPGLSPDSLPHGPPSAAAAAALLSPLPGQHYQRNGTFQPQLLGQSVSCNGSHTTHGRDFFYVELARPGGQCAVRLPGQHLGAGMYTFVGWEQVSPGPWNATFLLSTSAKATLFGMSGRNMTSALMDVGWQYEVRKFVNNTMKVVATVLLHKEYKEAVFWAPEDPWVSGNNSDNHQGVSPPSRAQLPQCMLPAKGEWLELPPNTTSCSQGSGLCKGSLAPLYLADPINAAERRFRHVYVPWSCTYRLYSLPEARACFAGKRLLLIGDSRFRQLNDSFFELLGLHRKRNGAGMFPAPGGGARDGMHLYYWRFKPDRAGIAALLAQWRTFLKHLTDYDVIITGSADHDIADYAYANLTLRSSTFGQLAASRAATGVGVPIKEPGDQCYPGGAFEFAKHRPFKHYLDMVAHFVKAFAAARAQLLAQRRRVAQVFWVLTGNRPYMSLPRGYCYPNQLDRMTCMHAEALSLLQRGTGIVPLDIATMQVDAPEQWWDDSVHIGKNTRNGMGAMTIQVLLNSICPRVASG